MTRPLQDFFIEHFCDDCELADMNCPAGYNPGSNTCPFHEEFLSQKMEDEE